MLFTETVAFKFNLQIDLIIILQIIKKNKYEKLVKRNGVMTFFTNFAKLMTSSHVLLKLIRKCFLETICCLRIFSFILLLLEKEEVFYQNKKKLNFCKRLYLNGHTFQKYYLLRVILSFF